MKLVHNNSANMKGELIIPKELINEMQEVGIDSLSILKSVIQ